MKGGVTDVILSEAKNQNFVFHLSFPRKRESSDFIEQMKQFIRETTGIIIIIVGVYFAMVVRNSIHYKAWDFNLFNSYNKDDTILVIALLILSVIVRNFLIYRKEKKKA